MHSTGSPWRDLPERFGPWQSVATRFYRWSKQGVWDRILHELQRQADEEGALDWSRHYVDGSSVRAHQHAAGAKRGSGALGRSRGGFGTKLHVRAEGNGGPVAFLVTPGQQHEASVFEELMLRGQSTGYRPGRPRLYPRRVVGDKGYSSGRTRRFLRKRRVGVTIPRRQDERHRGVFDADEYRLRNVVERLINRLKQFRRVATRYEKLARNYEAMLAIAAIRIWLTA